MFNNLPSVLTIDKLILPSKIYYTDDKGKNTLMATYLDQNRTPVKFDQINTVMYDALLSTRVYRAAWSHERAIALLREGAGTVFDASCVEALERVLARERVEPLAVAV